MFELLATSFPVIIKYFWLKRQGEAMTIWNMKTALFLWAFMAFMLFMVIFYFHPKSYTGLVPFRTVSVVAQTSGPVTEVLVRNGQTVSRGDVLFRIENSTQRAALDQASAEFDKVDAAQSKAVESLQLAEASFNEVQIALKKQREDLADAETLLNKGIGSEDKVRKARAAVDGSEAKLAATQAQVAMANTEINETVPAMRKLAETAKNRAQVALDQTEVSAFSDGVVTQMALSVGSPASKLVVAPAMVIIPKREEGLPKRITAGFSQVSLDVLHVGMPAEIACESNVKLSFKDSVIPTQIVSIQPAIASGQVVPSGGLREPNNAKKGSVLVYLELIHKEHEAAILDGSNCIVQTYTNNLEGLVGHIIAATGIVKAVGLRVKVWGALLSGIGLVGGGGH